ncbi:MAG: hypothetical protein GOMPHAMPRED_005026 [Gomphillus americanus]|uniref:Secreted protein n=1 Tax=Gomphillus americanus TaxID=1940652 RepID=A0A8H3I6W7_9LECA|nr:MAG: hypothetical protein GOMPHAMPRED_005026 [Gomphillus americanus]
MKQIFIFISWGAATLASIGPLARVWPNPLPSYSKNVYGENILRPRSPVRQRGQSSGPMQRAQNIPDSARPQHVPLNGSQGSASTSNTQHAHQPSSRSSNSMQRAQNIPTSDPPQGTRPAAGQRQRNTPDPSQTRRNPAGQYNTVVRGAVLGPAMVDMPGENERHQPEFIPWGRGELLSASGGYRHGIHVKTLQDPSGQRGEASLSAQGQRAAKVIVKAGGGASGQIERKAPLPAWQRRISSGQTDSETIVANPPPQHQYLGGDLKGQGEVKAIASSPRPPAR